MFKTKNLFASVLCPYQESCLLPQCIFQHSHEAVRSNASIVHLDIQVPPVAIQKYEQQFVSKTETDYLITTSSPPISTVDENSKKRKLVNNNTSSSANEYAKKQKLATNSDASQQMLNKRGNESLSIALTSKKAPATGLSSLQTPKLVPLKVLPKAIARAPPKEESLNPRALKAPAPASHDLRYRLLRALYNQFVRLNSQFIKNDKNQRPELALTDQSLISKALDIEEEATSSPSVYSNLVKNKILVYKRMSAAQWIEEREKQIAQEKVDRAKSESDGAAGKTPETPKMIETGMTLEEELDLLPQLKSDLSGLSTHGYVTELPSAHDIELARKGVEAARGWEVCDRCRSRFEVFPGRREADGALTSGGPCTYHFGRPYIPDRNLAESKAKRDKKYRCCGETVGDSSGCTTAPCHVFKISEVKRLASILNFEHTPENPRQSELKPVCVDGEMGYTVYGLELIRLTATSWSDGSDLFDVLVHPMGPILDLNSRYSGVYPEDIANAPPWAPDTPSNTSRLHIVESPAAARALLFSYLSPTTPLIGHGLENDLNATRIIHPTIIDTALLFPHKAGLPCRNSLKTLARIFLNRQIQITGDQSKAGHDSKEDANAAGQLVKYALKVKHEKLRLAKRLHSTRS